MTTERAMLGIRLCLNHSQSRLDQAISELSEIFDQWGRHPMSRSLRQKVVAELSDFEWMLSEHFQWLSADLSQHPNSRSTRGNFGDSRNAIYEWQERLLEDVDHLLSDARQVRSDALEVQTLIDRFHELRKAIEWEEQEERSLVQDSLT